jgi:hypothetical protein
MSVHPHVPDAHIHRIRNRDFEKKPGWLSQKLVPSRASDMSEGSLRLLHIVYNCGMAAGAAGACRAR